MLDSDKLARLEALAKAEDWINAADVCMELSTEAEGTSDEIAAYELTLAVRLHDAQRIPLLIGEIRET